MKTYHHNSENWYERDWSILHRIRNWFIWIGGWEKANGKGWELFRRNGQKKLYLCDPTPISLFGHRVTFFGNWLKLRTRNGWMVISREHCYISRNGTPSQAHVFYWGAPGEIITAAKEQRQDRLWRS